MILGARSLELALRREDFPATLKNLKRLARESPGELDDPAGVIAARTLGEAMAAMRWQATFDAHGDMVALTTTSPAFAEPTATMTGCEKVLPTALACALAKTCHGQFIVTSEGAATSVIFSHGRAHAHDYARQGFEQIGPVKASPGQTARLRFRLVGEVSADRVFVQMVRALGTANFRVSPWQAGPGVDLVELDESPMRPGDERDVVVTLSSSARGRVNVTVCARSSSTYFRGTRLEIDVDEPPGPEVWRVIDQTPAEPLYVMLGLRDAKRALLEAQRFAIRHASQPGGAFLHDVIAATSLAEAFQAAHIAGTLEARPSTFSIAGEQLPSTESQSKRWPRSGSYFSNAP